MDVTINNKVFEALRAIYEMQKEIIANSESHYMKGVYNGMEAFMSAIEEREPEYITLTGYGDDNIEH